MSGVRHLERDAVDARLLEVLECLGFGVVASCALGRGREKCGV